MIQTLDNYTGWIWFDGHMVPWQDARAHVLAHGLHYASSVFEAERAYNGKVFRMKEHHQRFLESAKHLDFEIPYSLSEIDAAVEKCLAENDLQDAYVRLVAYQGADNLVVSNREMRVHVAIAAWEMTSYHKDTPSIALVTSKWRRPAPESSPYKAKAASQYAIGGLSKQDRAKGFGDTLLLDYRGLVADASAANIFFIDDHNVCHTPVADCFLNGITRQTLLEILPVSGIEVMQRQIKSEEIETFKSAFLSGTAVEVLPISQIDDVHFPPCDQVKKIREIYQNYVRTV